MAMTLRLTKEQDTALALLAQMGGRIQTRGRHSRH